MSDERNAPATGSGASSAAASRVCPHGVDLTQACYCQRCDDDDGTTEAVAAMGRIGSAASVQGWWWFLRRFGPWRTARYWLLGQRQGWMTPTQFAAFCKRNGWPTP